MDEDEKIWKEREAAIRQRIEDTYVRLNLGKPEEILAKVYEELAAINAKLEFLLKAIWRLEKSRAQA